MEKKGTAELETRIKTNLCVKNSLGITRFQFCSFSVAYLQTAVNGLFGKVIIL